MQAALPVTSVMFGLGAMTGALLAALLVFLAYRGRLRGLEAQREDLQRRLAKAEQEAASQTARIEALQQARDEMVQTFRALGAQALEANNQQFLTLAEQRFETLKRDAAHDLERRETRIEALVRPLRDQLGLMDEHAKALEKSRVEAYARLDQQVESLHRETANLARSMRDYRQRGKWGELSLERAFEAAGLRLGQDYDRQVVLPGEESRQIPDYVVRLPGERYMIVDVKTPYDRYDEAVAATTAEEQTRLMREHARLVRDHIKSLRTKDYSRRLPGALPYVVMFLPLESMLAEALRVDPTLVDHGMESRVAIATPTTIVAMLSAVAHAWQQEEFARNCREIQVEAQKLYDALAGTVDKANVLSRRLNSAVEAHNTLVSYLDHTVRRTAIRVRDLRGGTAKELSELETLDQGALPSRHADAEGER